LRSDEVREGAEYYKEKDSTKCSSAKFFMKDGDGTTQFDQLNVVDATSGDKINLIKALINKVVEIKDELNKQLDDDEKSLKIATELTAPLKRD